MRFSISVLISVAAHVLIGLALWFYLEYVPSPDVLATLDLSGVELSFAEKEDESAAVLPQSAATEVPRPKLEHSATPVDAFPRNASEPLPEIPEAVDIPRPVEKPRIAPPPPRPTTVAPAPRQAKVDAPPRPKRNIKPDYPKGARQRGEQGDVVVEMLVNAQGAVDEVRIVTSSGFAELDEAALSAVRAAKFMPAKSGRESVASTARLTLTFKLK